MDWLLLTTLAYFINAGVYVADKFLLSRKIHSSITYAFYVGIWSIFNALILFLSPWIPTFGEFLLDISAGILFLFTLVFWYKALHQSEATRVVPIVGALIPIFSFILSYIFLGDNFDREQFLIFFILIAGGVLISIKNTRVYLPQKVINRLREIWGDFLGEVHAEHRPTRRLLVNSIISSLFFATYYVLMKYIYLNQPFIGSFVWSRFGTFLGCLFILLIPAWRSLIKEHRDAAKGTSNLSFFLAIRLAAALAFIILNWAVSLGNVAMINAMQGTQYAFLFIIILILSSKYPHVLKEEMGRGVLIQKTIGILLIGFGLYMMIL